jgi:hypothetical protein
MRFALRNPQFLSHPSLIYGFTPGVIFSYNSVRSLKQGFGFSSP